MKRLNEQLLAAPSYEASPIALSAILNNNKQIIGSDSVPFAYHPIESNNFQQVPKESSLRRAYKKLDEVQQQRWRALSIFPNEFDCAAAAALWRMKDQQEASALLKALEAQELVLCLPHQTQARAQAQDSPRYLLDHSARLFASARLSADEHEKALYRHAKHYKEVLQQAALLYEQGDEGLERGLALFEQEWANIQAGQFWSTDYAAQNQKAAALCRDYREVGSYMLLVGLDSEEWLAWQEAAVMATQYLHDYQNEQERELIELQELNSNAAEGFAADTRTDEGLQPVTKMADVEGLQAKALRLADEGAVYVEEGQVELAIERYNEQLAIVGRLDDEVWEAKILYQLANTYYLLDNIPSSIELYHQSRIIMHKLADLSGEVSTLIGLGNAYAELGEWQEAIGFYESCLQILHANQIVDPRAEAYLLEELGNAYELLGDLPRAITFYERLLACASQLEENESHSRALGYLGKAYDKSGQLKRAIDCYKQQVAIEQEAGNQSVEAKILGFLGHAYAEWDEYQLSIAYYQQQLSLVRELGKPDEEESTLWYLGLTHHKAGQIREASECYQQQLTIVRLLGKAEEEVQALEYLGLAYHKMGQVKQAIDCHQQQLTIAHQRKDWRAEASALEYLGLTYAELNQLPQAIKYFEQGLTIVSMFESRQAEARTLAYLANAYDLQGDGSRSIKFYQQALQLNCELEDKEEEASNLWHISLTLCQQGKIERAISYAEASLAIHEQLKAPAIAMRAGAPAGHDKLAMGRAGDTALARKESNIREQLKKCQLKGTFGTFLNVFKRTLRTSLFPAT